jgi:hypothetical protein
MATVYVKFQAQGERVGPKDCTSALPPNTGQSIALSGQYEAKATNLMILNGETPAIENWIRENDNKVTKLSETEANTIGQSMSPADVIRESTDPDGTPANSIAGTFTITEGQTWTPLTYLYLHIDMVDGDGKDPIGIINNGTDSMTVSAAFRYTDSVESPLVTAINEEWRVLIRDNDNSIYDVVLISFTAGLAVFQYTTTNRPAVCTMKESDLELIVLGPNTYKLKLVGTPKFTVFRTLS